MKCLGNKEVKKQYKKILQELVNQGKSFDEIISLLEEDNVSLSLNTRLFLQSIIKK